MPLPSTMVKVGTVRRRFAVLMSGIMGGGFSEAADADCGVIDVIANGVARAVWRNALLCLDAVDGVSSLLLLSAD